MKSKIALLVSGFVLLSFSSWAQEHKLRVVTSLSTYAAIAKEVGQNRVDVDWIVDGNQDPHFVRPKPSLARKLANADLFVSTGLDLELWAPALVDLSGNDEIRSGQRRFVSASHDVFLLEVPKVKSRAEGGVHIYGNPHFAPNPLSAHVVARNIASGLSRIDPDHAKEYAANMKAFSLKLDRKLFGEELVRILGSKILRRLGQKPQTMMDFLRKRKYKDKPLVEYLGGWLKEGLKFRGKKVVTYHLNWSYFAYLFGLQVINFVEPRPSIPPSPRHIQELIQQMRKEDVHVILAANYYNTDHIKVIADAVGAKSVIVAMGVGGAPGTDTYFDYVDQLIERVGAAFE
jgi:zinc/manganese transport system substrate-binding protein